MIYAEDDFLMLSGIQHFQFCKRQWALIHIEQQWLENKATAHGQILHKKADDPFVKEKRNDIMISRAMQVSSKILGLYGVLDVVEFHRSDEGTVLKGKTGCWMPTIVEYKRGKPKKDLRDIVQLVAQVICLEELLECTIRQSCLYYHGVNKKVTIDITVPLREKVIAIAEQMHCLYQERKIPKAEYFKNCQLCSLVDICLPRISKKGRSVKNYVTQAIETEDDL